MVAKDIDLPDCNPHLPSLIAAVRKFQGAFDDVSVDGLNLLLKHGRLTLSIPCLPEPPDVLVELAENEAGDYVDMPQGLIDSLETVLPFCGVDAFQLWSTSVLFDHHTLTATNTTALVQVQSDLEVEKRFCCPAHFFEMMVRNLSHFDQLSWSGGRVRVAGPELMLSSGLIEDKWPDSLEAILSAASEAQYVEFPSSEFMTLEGLDDLLDDKAKLFFLPDKITSSNDPNARVVMQMQTPFKGSVDYASFCKWLMLNPSAMAVTEKALYFTGLTSSQLKYRGALAVGVK